MASWVTLAVDRAVSTVTPLTADGHSVDLGSDNGRLHHGQVPENSRRHDPSLYEVKALGREVDAITQHRAPLSHRNSTE